MDVTLLLVFPSPGFKGSRICKAKIQDKEGSLASVYYLFGFFLIGLHIVCYSIDYIENSSLRMFGQ